MPTPKKKPYEQRLRKAESRPEPARDGKKARRLVRITIDQYNALFRSFQSKPSIAAAARAAGVDAATAKHYIDGVAAPEAGMEPIGARVARINAAVNEHHDLTYQEFRMREARVWQDILKTSDVELAALRNKYVEMMRAIQAGQPVETPQTFYAAVKSRAEVSRMVEHMLNGPDVSIEVRRAGPDPLIDMDKEELLTYAQTGVLPERHRH
jgi:hypothetical protein